MSEGVPRLLQHAASRQSEKYRLGWAPRDRGAVRSPPGQVAGKGSREAVGRQPPEFVGEPSVAGRDFVERGLDLFGGQYPWGVLGAFENRLDCRRIVG